MNHSFSSPNNRRGVHNTSSSSSDSAHNRGDTPPTPHRLPLVARCSNTSQLPGPVALPVMRHPLQNSWTLWFFKNDRARPWEENQRPVLSFQTVEDFWAVYNHVEFASKLPTGCDYSLFKEGVKPMWEDDLNRHGGRWLINLDKKQRNYSLDNFWLEVMLCLVGEAFGCEHGTLVNGAVVSVRNKGDKIGIWLGDASRGDSILEVGKKVKERLAIDSTVALGFETHMDSMRKAGSTAKNKFVI